MGMSSPPIFKLDDRDEVLGGFLRAGAVSVVSEWVHVTPSSAFVRHQGDAVSYAHLFSHALGGDSLALEYPCSEAEYHIASRMAYRRLRLERFAADTGGRAWDVDFVEAWNSAQGRSVRTVTMALADAGTVDVLPPPPFADRITLTVPAEDARVMAVGRLSLCLYADHVEDLYLQSGASACDSYLHLAEIAEKTRVPAR